MQPFLQLAPTSIVTCRGFLTQARGVGKVALEQWIYVLIFAMHSCPGFPFVLQQQQRQRSLSTSCRRSRQRKLLLSPTSRGSAASRVHAMRWTAGLSTGLVAGASAATLFAEDPAQAGRCRGLPPVAEPVPVAGFPHLAVTAGWAARRCRRQACSGTRALQLQRAEEPADAELQRPRGVYRRRPPVASQNDRLAILVV